MQRHATTGAGDFASVRVRLDLGYDGTDFSGWAVQPGRRTVAGVLAEALARILGPDAMAGLTVAGRTDAGVHATGQVCHLDVCAQRWSELGASLPRRLAGLLPPDVRVYRVAEAPAGFDARFSATFRRYRYRVTDLPWGVPPLRHHDTVAWPRELDVDRLNAAAELLLGEHDFAAYCRRKEHATTVRAISRLTWRRILPEGDQERLAGGGQGHSAGGGDTVIVCTVEADAFCQAMVRSLVGALLPVGDGRRPIGWPGSLLARRERASDVVVAPPHGLTLVAVGYPADPADYERRALLTRNLRVPQQG